jgi:hypothetical protein
MSTMSLIESDQSDRLARRFADLASSYFDRREEARGPGAAVPLENLFRILQMFRYNAFSDEPRGGILELEGFGERTAYASTDEIWHKNIEDALSKALDDIFADTPKEAAIEEVQKTLSWLATDTDAPSVDAQKRTKEFLGRFVAALG